MSFGSYSFQVSTYEAVTEVQLLPGHSSLSGKEKRTSHTYQTEFSLQ